MTQVSTQASFYTSRLVRLLSNLAITDVSESHIDLSQRLGKLINLSSSITLSGTLGKLSKLTYEPHDVGSEASWKEFLRIRGLLVESIIKSFVSTDNNMPTANNGQVKILFPMPMPGKSLNDPGAYEPYRRFYAAQQREIDLKVQYMQSFVRDAASGLSPRLAQLVEVDTAIGDILAMQQRKCFAVTPTLLEKRFKHLFPPNSTAAPESEGFEQGLLPIQDAHPHRAATSPQFDQFAWEVQNLLLAELDVRFQPVVCLIEAINEETDHQYD